MTSGHEESDRARLESALLQLEKRPGEEEEGVVAAIAKYIAKQSVPGWLGRLQWPGTLFPVVCKKSRIHGKGVFATRDIQENEALTLYPPDGLLIRVGDASWRQFKTGDAKPQMPLETLIDRYSYMLMEERDMDGVRLVGFPELDQDSAYLGHLINDAAGPCEREKQYWDRACKRINALPKRVNSAAHVMYVAARDIPKGSEVLTAYGPEYWRGVEANAALRATPP